MAGGNPVWGVEIGQCALKAVKLRLTGEQQVELVAFDLIEHPKILSQPDADADELIGAALEKFASRNDWHGDRFVIGVPGQQTFSRFCKLPPVDAKKIPDIVRFEASQQIPFDMDDVVWDYQVFRAGQVPDVEVGIFAMRKDLIRKYIDYFSGIGIAPAAVQTIPSALYNFCRFDGQGGEGTTVIIDVGAQNTDLIIAEPNSAWMRNIPLGGNSFTEALIKAFKLSFAKAESLKRTAATSKYARQIFQAMRPVFAELVAEIQRSIGFYSSTHREMELQRVLACGNAFRLPGLQKYLENNLTISGGVTRLEKFKALVPSATINAPQFAENILSFAPAYGLALQGLELAALGANLLPPELARIALWKKTRPLFVAAAACLGLAALCPWARSMIDASALRAGRPDGDDAERIVDNARELNRRFQAVSADTGQWQRNIDKLLDLQKHKRLIPHIIALVHDAMPEPAPEVANARTPAELKELIESNPQRFGRTQRKQILIESLEITYVANIDQHEGVGGGGARAAAGGWESPLGGPAAIVGGGGGRFGPRGRMDQTMDYMRMSSDTSEEGGEESKPGFYVHMHGRLLYGKDLSDAASLLTEDYFPRLKQFGQRPGLGLHVLDEDPKSEDKLNIRLREIRKYYGETSRGPAYSGPTGVRGIRGVRSPRGIQGGGVMVAGEPTMGDAGASRADEFRDPVTDEPMTTDWKFEMGFKIKLGEKPAQETSKEPE
jgi:type IV pilus assembly protein PilM